MLIMPLFLGVFTDINECMSSDDNSCEHECVNTIKSVDAKGYMYVSVFMLYYMSVFKGEPREHGD